jgi:hypothetical protein
MIRGTPSLYTVPANADPWDISARQLVHQGTNTVCFGLYDAMLQYLLRNVDDWAPTSIVLGFGGDYDQPEDPDTTAPSDQGVRVPPTHSDAYVRKPFFSAAIQQTKEGIPTTERRAVYVAVIRPDDANTDPEDEDRPFIDELGLEARNGTLLAHYITSPDLTTVGETQKFAKSSLQWLVIEWTLEFIGVEP